MTTRNPASDGDQHILYKRLFAEAAGSPSPVWAFENTKDPSTTSVDFYALVVPQQIHPYLNDFSVQEEVAFWDLTFEISRKAIEDLSRSVQSAGMMIGLNDGLYAGQTIPHAHSHIMTLREITPTENLGEQADRLRSEVDSTSLPPLATETVTLHGSDVLHFTRGLRDVRKRLASQHQVSDFRIYSQNVMRGATTDLTFNVDACNQERPQYSVAKIARVWNGLCTPAELKDYGFALHARFKEFRQENTL